MTWAAFSGAVLAVFWPWLVMREMAALAQSADCGHHGSAPCEPAEGEAGESAAGEQAGHAERQAQR